MYKISFKCLYFLNIGILCPDLEDPVYGSVDDGDNRPGTKAVYTCNKGFKLVGESERKCQYSGEWTGEAPVCKCKFIHVSMKSD